MIIVAIVCGCLGGLLLGAQNAYAHSISVPISIAKKEIYLRWNGWNSSELYPKCTRESGYTHCKLCVQYLTYIKKQIVNKELVCVNFHIWNSKNIIHIHESELFFIQE